MVNNDTKELLKECEQGVKMGIEAISEVLPRTDDAALKKILTQYLERHEGIKDELADLMREHEIEESDPNLMAKAMSYLKTSFKMMAADSDRTVADLMTDGCDMGIKTLNKYMNRYESAQNAATDIAKRLIGIEEEFSTAVKSYL